MPAGLAIRLPGSAASSRSVSPARRPARRPLAPTLRRALGSSRDDTEGRLCVVGPVRLRPQLDLLPHAPSRPPTEAGKRLWRVVQDRQRRCLNPAERSVSDVRPSQQRPLQHALREVPVSTMNGRLCARGGCTRPNKRSTYSVWCSQRCSDLGVLQDRLRLQAARVRVAAVIQDHDEFDPWCEARIKGERESEFARCPVCRPSQSAPSASGEQS